MADSELDILKGRRTTALYRLDLIGKGAQLTYDDGYFLAGGFAQANGPTHTTPDSIAFGVKFVLKAPGAEFGIGY